MRTASLKMSPAINSAEARRRERDEQLKAFRPTERSGLMRLFYRNWRPTRLGRWANRFACWWSGLGLPPRIQAALEVHGRTSGRIRSNPVVIAAVKDKLVLCQMVVSQQFCTEMCSLRLTQMGRPECRIESVSEIACLHPIPVNSRQTKQPLLM